MAALHFATGGDENGHHEWAMQSRRFHASYTVAALIFKG
jgi:hypothetical protein